MAKNVEVTLNPAGVRDLLRSKEIQSIVKKHADAIQRRAGDGYETSTFVGKNRCNASVKAKTSKARRDNLKNNTLLKAVRG